MVKQYTWEGYYIPGTRVLRNLLSCFALSLHERTTVRSAP